MNSQWPPESRVAPRFANGEPIFASSATYTTSVAIARPRPTPRQAPCTAAKVGTGISDMARSTGVTLSRR